MIKANCTNLQVIVNRFLETAEVTNEEMDSRQLSGSFTLNVSVDRSGRIA
jgi:hypothetical protein